MHGKVSGADRMLKPVGSRIVDAKPAHNCPGCGSAGVHVQLMRADGNLVWCWTHDDGSFVEWTAESNTQ